MAALLIDKVQNLVAEMDRRLNSALFKQLNEKEIHSREFEEVVPFFDREFVNIYHSLSAADQAHVRQVWCGRISAVPVKEQERYPHVFGDGGSVSYTL